MSTISNVDQVLAEMRRLTAAAQSTPAGPDQVQPASGENFASLLKQSVDEVNSIQQTAGKLSSAFSAGDPNVYGCPPEGRRGLPGDDRGAKPAGFRLPGNHEHAGLTKTGSSYGNG